VVPDAFGVTYAFHPVTGLLYVAQGGSRTAVMPVLVIDVAACTTNLVGNTNYIAHEAFAGNMVGDTFYFFNYATSELLSFSVTDPTLTVYAVVAVGAPLNVGVASGGASLFNLCSPTGYIGMQLYIARTAVLNQTGGLDPVTGAISTTPFTLTTNGLPGGSYFGVCKGTTPVCYHPWFMTSACFPATTNVAPPGTIQSDAKSPRVGLYFHSSVATTLTGVQFYSVSGTLSITWNTRVLPVERPR